MANVFPTLSTPPVYPLKESRDPDSTIKSKTESGYTITRSRYSKVRMIFEVNYSNLSQSDKDLLDTFIDIVLATDTFTWTHPSTGSTYTVRFDEIPEISLSSTDGDTNYYSTTFKLNEE